MKRIFAILALLLLFTISASASGLHRFGSLTGSVPLPWLDDNFDLVMGPEVDALVTYGSGITYTDATITAALSAMGTTTKGTLLLRPGTWVISASKDWSAYTNVTFKIMPGAILSHGTYTLNIPNPIAGVYQWLSGTGAVTFCGTIKEVYPEWFGAVADNSTDNTNALQYALNSQASGGVVKFSTGTYRFTYLSIPNDNTTLKGDGWGSSLSTTISAVANTVPVIWVKANGVILKDFKTTWVTLPTALQSGTSIEQNDVIAIGRNYDTTVHLYSNILIDNVYVYGAKQHGISVGYTNNVTVKNCRVEEIYGTGIFPKDVQNFKCIDNFIYRTNDAGIDLQSGTGRYCDNAIINNNVIQYTSIAIGSHGGRNVTINNNTIDSTWVGGIYAQVSAFYGVGAPHQTIISGNTLRRIFQFFGAGNFHALDINSTIPGIYDAIECLSDSDVVISGNIVRAEDTDTRCGGGINAQGTSLNITGNTVIGIGYLQISPNVASDYTLVGKLTMTGNIFHITSPYGTSTQIVLNGVGGGIISGNYFDCGGLGLSDPQGRWITGTWVKNLLVTKNNVLNCTGRPWADNGNNYNISFIDNFGLTGSLSGAGMTGNYATDAQFQDKTAAINVYNKYYGRRAYSTTSHKWYHCEGTGAVTDPWYNDAGTLVYTPN